MWMETFRLHTKSSSGDEKDNRDGEIEIRGRRTPAIKKHNSRRATQQRTRQNSENLSASITAVNIKNQPITAEHRAL